MNVVPVTVIAAVAEEHRPESEDLTVDRVERDGRDCAAHISPYLPRTAPADGPTWWTGTDAGTC